MIKFIMEEHNFNLAKLLSIEDEGKAPEGAGGSVIDRTMINQSIYNSIMYNSIRREQEPFGAEPENDYLMDPSQFEAKKLVNGQLRTLMIVAEQLYLKDTNLQKDEFGGYKLDYSTHKLSMLFNKFHYLFGKKCLARFMTEVS